MFLKALINNVKHLFTRNQQKPKDSNNQSPWDNLSLGDRMKLYESFFTGSNFPGKYPYWPSRHCVRIPSECLLLPHLFLQHHQVLEYLLQVYVGKI